MSEGRRVVLGPLVHSADRGPCAGDLRWEGRLTLRPPRVTPSPRRTTIWTLRVRFLEEQALPRWATFTIWNAGRQGRRLYRSLTAESRRKVGASPAPCPLPRHYLSPPFPPPRHPPTPWLVSCVLHRWSPSATWTRTRSRRASTATRSLRWALVVPSPVPGSSRAPAPRPALACSSRGRTGSGHGVPHGSPGPPLPPGKAQAPGPSPALPSRTAALCHLREAGECGAGGSGQGMSCPPGGPGLGGR